jgi:hypothetical protein
VSIEAVAVGLRCVLGSQVGPKRFELLTVHARGSCAQCGAAVGTSQIRTVLSMLPEARVLPSPANARLETGR